MSDDTREESIMDLFREIALAKQRMSVSNPHRLIFAKCESALWHLSAELHRIKQLPFCPACGDALACVEGEPRVCESCAVTQEGVTV